MTVNPRQSFKLKLFLSILSVSLVTFLLIFSAALYFTSKEIKDSVSSIVTSKLTLATRALEDRLNNIEIAAENFVGLVESPYVQFDKIGGQPIIMTYLEANPQVQGICVGYEDGSKFGYPGPWCPYVMRQNGEYIYRDLSKTKNFRESEWYKTPHDTHSKVWSKPFRESNGTIIASYNIPVLDKTIGETQYVVALDQNLNSLSDSLQLLRPYEGSNLYLIDKDGRYLAHPSSDSVFVGFADSAVMDFIATGADYMEYKRQDGDVYLFPGTVSPTGWTVLLSVPRSAMVSRSTKMMRAMLIDMILGILLLLFVSMYVIHRLTKPLEDFAEAAKQISHGDFNVDLPVINDHNELYDLRSALASMSVSLDNYIKQLAETSSKKASIERELDIARNIQMAMIPKIFPPYPHRNNLDIFASLAPAQAVGGDLYDFVLCGDKFFFCIGDVSGKGVPASLFMAITRTLFRNNASEDKTPSQIATILNDSIASENDMGMFVTMCIASFDLITGELQICNCGHNLPATNGTIADPKEMKATPDAPFHLMNGVPNNIAIGVMPGFKYTDVTISITPGCMLMLYTDGVTEAENDAKELYEEKRMLECLESLPTDHSSEDAVVALVDDVKAFVGNASQNDDITVLCLRCKFLG